VVEADQPADLAQTAGEVGHARQTAKLLELRHERPDQDEIDVAARCQHLVGDVDVAVPA
jgi:hypothetical protein